MKERLKNLIRYYWLAYLIAAVLSLFATQLIFHMTKPPIPPDKLLKVKIAAASMRAGDLMEWGEQLEQQLNLEEVSIDFHAVNIKNLEDPSWSRFNTYVIVGDADVYLIPANKAEQLAELGVLMDLKTGASSLTDNIDIARDERYTYNDEIYALKADKATAFSKYFLLNLGYEGGQPGTELVFCIQRQTQNLKGAVDWINAVINMESAG
ncbi:MAG TPA: hypothetical protein PLZ84_00860 [Clostridia bacterium]|nr:hypothetical protein [Clostridia bacterium]